jgi:hypothetical protein
MLHYILEMVPPYHLEKILSARSEVTVALGANSYQAAVEVESYLFSFESLGEEAAL